MKISTIAANDAYDIGTAKLLIDDVAWKTENISGYAEALNKAYEKQDLKMEAEFLAKYRNKLVKKGFTGEKAVGNPKLKAILIIAGVTYVGYRVYKTNKKVRDFVNKGETYDRLVDKTAAKITKFVDGDTAAQARHLKEKVVEVKDSLVDPEPHNVYEAPKPDHTPLQDLDYDDPIDQDNS